MVQGLKVGNINSISMVKYSMLHTLWRHVYVTIWLCNQQQYPWLLSVIEYLNIKQLWSKICHVKISDNCFIFSSADRICSCSSYFLSFIEVFAENQPLTFLSHPVCISIMQFCSLWTLCLERSTTYSGCMIWYTRTANTALTSLPSFQRQLKTFLFTKSFPPV